MRDTIGPSILLVCFTLSCAHTPESGHPVVTKQHGELTCRGPEADGRPQGYWVCVNPRKTTISKIHYTAGKRDGLAELFFEDGKPDTVAMWKDGVMEGEFRSYYRSGGISFRSNYSQGLLHGEMSEWNESGVLIARTNYKMGVPHGLSQEWHANGKLKSEGMFEDGKPVGISMEWRDDGSVRRRSEYSGGKPAKVQSFTADGRPE